jgi:hypothetical protein
LIRQGVKLSVPVPSTKKDLPADAEIPAAEVVLGEELAGRAETADNFHLRCRRLTAGAEELGWLVLFQRVLLIILAVYAILPAELTVLFVVFDNRFIGLKHEGKGRRQ